MEKRGLAKSTNRAALTEYMIKATTFGGDAFASDADDSRAGLEAEVASLKETVASLEGKVSALQEQSEKLFAILEARPEQ